MKDICLKDEARVYCKCCYLSLFHCIQSYFMAFLSSLHCVSFDCWCIILVVSWILGESLQDDGLSLNIKIHSQYGFDKETRKTVWWLWSKWSRTLFPFPLRCTQRGLTRLDKDCQATMMMEKSVQRKKKLNALFSLRRQRKTIVVLSVTQEKNLLWFSLSSYLLVSDVWCN